MADQTVLFAVMPRAISVNSAALPVSVLVAPRLGGATTLDQFPDWLDWTGQLASDGLAITFRCGLSTTTIDIDTGPLKPALWGEMFNESTFVRPYTFDDYTDRTIFSYSTRLALSAIKAIYQQAGVDLALPDRSDRSNYSQEQSPRRQLLKDLLSGLEVNWNKDKGESLRADYRGGFGSLTSLAGLQSIHYPAVWLAPDGTIKNFPKGGESAASALKQFVSNQFAVYSHMPQGAPLKDNPPNFDELIDFHQALSSLNSYPELLRALGLCFDLELPADFVAGTPINAPGSLAVVDLPGRSWAIQTSAPPNLHPQETAYLYFSLGDPADPWKVFTTAPGLLGGGLNDLEVFGLLNLDPTRFGLAQVDVDSAMNKNVRLAETWVGGKGDPAPPDHPEVFDETTTLPALRSGGFSVFSDGRALRLSKTFQENEQFNQDLENGLAPQRPFYAEDLTHGYRVDIWDSFTGDWHSLHLRHASYKIGDEEFVPEDPVEGFLQLAAGQAAPDPDNPPPNDLYLNESIARWAGWSLSVPFPGKQLSRDPDPEKALEHDPDHPLNEPATPFKMTTHFDIVKQSLPALRFGRRYRVRLRAVDVCGNSLPHDGPLSGLLALLGGLPRDLEGFPYLRYEPVAAPMVVLRDVAAVTGPGSQLHRLVIRTFNDSPEKDTDPADLTASDRFIAPPSTSVEVGERLGMFDEAGKLVTSAAMYNLIGGRDKGQFNQIEAVVAGQEQQFPLESGMTIDELPYLPDVLARGAALRDLPGSQEGALASVQPNAGAAAPLPYTALGDANPRPGSAALVGFGGQGDWQNLTPFRLALADGGAAPTWDPQNRELTVFLPKASRSTVPLSSYLHPDDLKLMGIWQWLREYIDRITVQSPDVPVADPDMDAEKIAHLLQRAMEGGHWMITPPRLLTLIHAVQQPLGLPVFSALAAQHVPYGSENPWGQVDEKIDPDPDVLQTAPEAIPTAESELGAITAWRKPGSPEAYLLGGLKIHGASTEKVDLLATWEDPFDDTAAPRLEGEAYFEEKSAHVEEIPLGSTQEGYLIAGSGTANYRLLAYYDADHDLMCFARSGDQLGNLKSGVTIYGDAAPRHYLNDTKYHRVHYTARASSRFREYFAQDEELVFSRDSEPISVEVPASARPALPAVSYVVPTFGWQRQTQTNLKRSVRFGGGLRVYLDRPWFSSGEGELLGVALYDYINGSFDTDDREIWKPYITQWGADPIWSSPGLYELPSSYSFPNAVASEGILSLPGSAPGRVQVAGFPVDFDYETQKWFADLTVDTSSQAYMPFIRLALVRYQPFALVDSKLSPVALADYIQLTPERSAVVTADPYHPRRLRVTVSGPAPSGPAPKITGAQPSQPVNLPTLVTVTLQRRSGSVLSDMAWGAAPELAATIAPELITLGGLVRWSGSVEFSSLPEAGEYRLLIREYEYLSANYVERTTVTGRTPGGRRTRRVHREQPKRLIYAETIEVDSALIGGPPSDLGTTL